MFWTVFGCYSGGLSWKGKVDGDRFVWLVSHGIRTSMAAHRDFTASQAKFVMINDSVRGEPGLY